MNYKEKVKKNKEILNYVNSLFNYNTDNINQFNGKDSNELNDNSKITKRKNKIFLNEFKDDIVNKGNKTRGNSSIPKSFRIYNEIYPINGIYTKKIVSNKIRNYSHSNIKQSF